MHFAISLENLLMPTATAPTNKHLFLTFDIDNVMLAGKLYILFQNFFSETVIEVQGAYNQETISTTSASILALCVLSLEGRQQNTDNEFLQLASTVGTNIRL